MLGLQVACFLEFYRPKSVHLHLDTSTGHVRVGSNYRDDGKVSNLCTVIRKTIASECVCVCVCECSWRSCYAAVLTNECVYMCV